MSSTYRFPGLGSYIGGETFYKSSKRQRRSTDHLDGNLSKHISKLKKNVEEIKRPIGRKDNPARDCRDLLYCGRKLKDGKRRFLAMLLRLVIPVNC